MHTIVSRLVGFLAACPYLLPVLIVGASTLFTLDARDLWHSDEIRYADVYTRFEEAGKRLALYLNDRPYPDKPPGYFLFLSMLRPFFSEIGPGLFMAGAALSGMLLVAAGTLVCRSIFGADKKTAMAAGLIIATGFYFIGVSHYSRMDSLFAAVIACAHVCLFKGLMRDEANKWTTAGFVLGAVAVLIKGPLGLALPLLAAVTFLAWRGRLSRLLCKDAAYGLGIAALLLCGWIGAVWLAGEREFVHNIFYKQIYKRAVDASHHPQPIWYYLWALPAAWLPWSFLLFFPAARGAFTPKRIARAWQSRKDGDAGRAYVWCAALSGFVLLSLVSIKIIIYLLPLFPFLACLSADALASMERRQSGRLFLAFGLLFLILALGAPTVNQFHHWPIRIDGLLPAAGAFAAVSLLCFILLRRLDPLPALSLFSLAAAGWIFVVAGNTAPSLDPVMSPRAQAEVMGEYIDKGYAPAAYRLYSGSYSYYADAVIYETHDHRELAAFLNENEKAVIGMRLKHWNQWKDRPQGLRILHEQFIVNRPYVLIVKEETP